MSLAQELFQEVNTAPTERAVQVTFHGIGMESAQDQAIIQRLMRELKPTHRIATESQQIDQAETEAAVLQAQDQIAAYTETHPTTGPIHVYLLNSKDLKDGDTSGPSVLSALAATALNNPERTVAAFLPEDKEPAGNADSDDGEPAFMGKQQTLQSYLATLNVPSFESLDELVHYLNVTA